MPSVEIREANAGDAATISTLISELAQAYIVPDCTPDGAARLLESMSVSAIRRRFADGYDYHLACIDEETVGVVGTRNDSHLYHLFVAQRFHRQGIASL